MTCPNRTGPLLVAVLLSLWSGLAAAEVVIVVSSKSPVATLTKNQVIDIFLGRSSRFPNGEQATPIDQPEASSMREAFYGEFVGKSAAQLKAHWSKIIFTGRGQPPRIVPTSADVKKLLAANPSAIGYIEVSQVDPSVRVVRPP